MPKIADQKSNIRMIFRSYEWLIRDDIRRKDWRGLAARVENMKQEMGIFASSYRIDSFLKEQLGEW